MIMLMPRKIHRKIPLEKRIIDKIIFVVAAIQPLGTIPQAITIYRRHNATSISITSWVIYIVFDLLCLWYGYEDKQKAVMISAALFMLLESIILVGAFRYGGSW